VTSNVYALGLLTKAKYNVINTKIIDKMTMWHIAQLFIYPQLSLQNTQSLLSSANQE